MRALVRGEVRVDEAQVRRAHAEGEGDPTLVRAHAAHARRHLGRVHAVTRRGAGCGAWGCRLVAVGLQAVAEAHRSRLDLADGLGEVRLAEHEQVDLAHRDVAHLVRYREM